MCIANCFSLKFKTMESEFDGFVIITRENSQRPTHSTRLHRVSKFTKITILSILFIFLISVSSLVVCLYKSLKRRNIEPNTPTTVRPPTTTAAQPMTTDEIWNPVTNN